MNLLQKAATGACVALTAAGVLIAQHGASATAGPNLAGYPNAENTGVPTGAKLVNVPSSQSSGSGWHWSTSYGGVIIDGPGTVFRNFNVSGAIEVFAPNVTVKYNSVLNSGEGWTVGIRHGAANTFVYRNDFAGPCNRCTDRLTYGVNGNLGGDTTHLTVARNNFSDIDHPLQQESGLIRGNYVHDVATQPNDKDHVDAFFSGGGDPGQLTIRHNTLLTDTPYEGATAAIMLNNAFGAQSNRLIEDNLLGGGGFVFYGGGGGGETQNGGRTAPPASAVIFRNNQITTAYNAKGGYYGPFAYTSGDTMSGNTWLDGAHAGQTIAS